MVAGPGPWAQCNLPSRAPPSRGARGATKKQSCPFCVPGIVPMAPGGPWDHFPRPECSKRWHGDPFGDIFDFWSIFCPETMCSLLNRNNFCVAQRQLLCCTETNLCVAQRQEGGGLRAAAGGGRAVAPTQTPLVSPHPPKIAIPLLGGISKLVGCLPLTIGRVENSHCGLPL